MTMQCNLKCFTLETTTSPIRIRLENTYWCEIISPVVVLIASNAVGINIAQLPTHHRLYFFSPSCFLPSDYAWYCHNSIRWNQNGLLQRISLHVIDGLKDPIKVPFRKGKERRPYYIFDDRLMASIAGNSSSGPPFVFLISCLSTIWPEMPNDSLLALQIYSILVE